MGFARKMMFLGVLLVFAAAHPLFAQSYANVSNVPFETISNGPQNAIVVDVSNPSDQAQVDAAVNVALSRVRTSRAANGALSRQISKLKQAGLLPSDQNYFLDELVLIRSKGSFDEPAGRASRAYGSGTITFQYTGWDATTEGKLKAFVNIAYPIVKQIYGDPAKSITVNVIADQAQTVTDQLLGGVYVTGSGVQREIRLYPTPSGQILDLERLLLHSMIRAFHDTAAFNYDAWEEGFHRAAAVVAGEQIDQAIQQNPATGLKQMDIMGKTVSGDAFSYLMANYEVLNQPALSNNKFAQWGTDPLGSLDVFGGMLIPRSGMASTAWLKVYIERLRTDGQSFFKLFNQTYYSQLAGNSALAGNVPLLKNIASGVTAEVEGLSFDDWFSRQYIFDSSVSLGKKLYAFTYPINAPDNGETDGYSLPTFLIYYQTAANGGESPLSGTIYPVYWDYQYKNDLFTSSQYETVTVDNGEGYVTPTFYVNNIGGSQRVAMDFTIGPETARVFFPAGMAGTSATPTTVAGIVVGTNTGSVSVKVASNAPVSTSVINGAYGAYAVIPDFSQLTITFTPSTGTPVTRVVNAGPGAYEAFLYAKPGVKSLDHTFVSGARMISIPMTTLAQDADQALSGSSGDPAIAADKLLLARWNPALTGGTKYEIYPEISSFAPGKGYWMKLPATTTVTVTGEVPDPSGSYRIGLEPGWNQIGGPFETGVDIANITVEKGNDEPVTFSQAWSTGLVSKTIWKYVSGTGYVQATTLDPWEGYWIKCNVPTGVVLVVPGPGNKSRAAKVDSSTPVGSGSNASKQWAMKLSAATATGDASCVTLGVAPGATDSYDNAYDAEVPPLYGVSTQISAILPGRAGEACGVDTRAAGTTKLSWDVTVTPTGPNQDVIVKWQDIAETPKAYRLTLVDQASGRSLYMRTASSYRFNSGDGSPRKLTVVADSTPTAKLMITGLMVGPSRGSAVTFSYNLSSEAQISAEIVSASGKHIRTLDSGRATRSGINNMAWDKRDDNGESVPSGIYMLQLNAASEEGEVVKSVRPVMVAR